MTAIKPASNSKDRACGAENTASDSREVAFFAISFPPLFLEEIKFVTRYPPMTLYLPLRTIFKQHMAEICAGVKSPNGNAESKVLITKISTAFIFPWPSKLALAL